MKLKIGRYMWLKNIRKIDKQAYVLVLFMIGVVFYMMNTYTPLSADDYRYAFTFGFPQRIETLDDIIISQYHHYFVMNGRLVPHLFIQYFVGIVGKSIFNFVNTIIFVCFIHILVLLSKCDKRDRYKAVSILFATICLFYPAFSDCFLWISGCVNNLWSATMVLSFHLLFEKDIKSKYVLPCCFIMGLLCGWTHEGIVLGMIAGYMTYLYIYPSQITWSRAILLIGMAVGILFLVFSPGSISRAVNKNDNNAIILMLQSVFSLFKNGIIIILLLLICFLRKFKKIFLSYKINLIWFVAFIVSAIFLVVVAKASYGRSYFGISLFALILIINILNYGGLFSYIKDKNIHVLNVLLMLFSFSILYFQKENFKDWNNVVEQIEKKYAIVCTDELNPPLMYDRYIVRYLIPETDEFYESFLKDKSKEVERFSRFYQSENVQFLPKRFVEDVFLNPLKYKEFVNDDNIPFYVKEVETDNINNVLLLLRDVKHEDIPFYLRPISDRLQRYTAKQVSASNFNIVVINENKYILITKNRAVNERVVDMVLCVR